jgi:hypothetical protein
MRHPVASTISGGPAIASPTPPAQRLVTLPPHEPCGTSGCGPVDEENRITCTTHRSWPGGFKAVDRPGCGAIFSLCEHGIRGHCGKVERPAKTGVA